MNVADSQRVSSALERLGYSHSPQAEEADVIVLNTCVVRQSAENKAYGRLSSLRPLKDRNPNLVINLMGCLVGVRSTAKLQARFPYVDVFSPPSDPGPLVAHLTQAESQALEASEVDHRYAVMDSGELTLPAHEQGSLVSAFIPVVYGCSHACTYCIIPYQRGIERSRPAEDILAEARALARQGVKEITLLGQIVDRYGKGMEDQPSDAPVTDGITLSGLLARLHAVEGVERIRFLTSHPNWFNDELIDAVASLPKVMPHIEVPIQAGDDEVLTNMKRGYTADDYRRLVEKIRARIPDVSIATDIIVGFPGETAAQFEHTYELLAELKLDVAHLARYSSRPDTVATRRMVDDISPAEKMERFRRLETLQENIAAEIHGRLLGKQVEVLFEEKVKGRWKGRTPNTQLVFVESEGDLRGQILPVEITWTGPWSMQGRLL